MTLPYEWKKSKGSSKQFSPTLTHEKCLLSQRMWHDEELALTRWPWAPRILSDVSVWVKILERDAKQYIRKGFLSCHCWLVVWLIKSIYYQKPCKHGTNVTCYQFSFTNNRCLSYQFLYTTWQLYMNLNDVCFILYFMWSYCFRCKCLREEN